MYVKVIATPNARKERVELKDAVLYIWVREPAIGNRANERIRELVARQYATTRSQVRILTGHHSRSKMIDIST